MTTSPSASHLPATCPEVGCGCTAYTDDPKGGTYARSTARKFDCGRVIGAGMSKWCTHSGAEDHRKNAQAQITALLAHVERLQQGLQDVASEMYADDQSTAVLLRELAAVDPQLPQLGS